jgi:tankyrase
VPLHRAAIGHNIDTATALLSSGANVNAANRWGNTPLHLAAVYERGKQPMVDLLLAHGADPTLRNSDGRTALEGGASAAITESALEALASGEPLLRRD